MAAEEATTLEAEVAADTMRSSSSCSVCDWLEGRDDAAIWNRMMAAPIKRYGHIALYTSMCKRGYPFKSAKPIETHRRQGHSGPA